MVSMKQTAEKIVAYALVIVISLASPLYSFAQEPSGGPIANPSAIAVAPPAPAAKPLSAAKAAPSDPNESWPQVIT